MTGKVSQAVNERIKPGVRTYILSLLPLILYRGLRQTIYRDEYLKQTYRQTDIAGLLKIAIHFFNGLITDISTVKYLVAFK